MRKPPPVLGVRARRPRPTLSLAAALALALSALWLGLLGIAALVF